VNNNEGINGLTTPDVANLATEHGIHDTGVNEVGALLQKQTPDIIDAIISNREILEKIYIELSKPRYNLKTEIDIGEGYGKTDIESIIYYIQYYTGIMFRSSDNDSIEGLREFINIKINNPDKFTEYSKSHSGNKFSKISHADLMRGFNISSILPGAPDLVMTPTPYIFHKDEMGLHDVSDQDTEKVHDLLQLNEADFAKLGSLIKDKIVIELGAGSRWLGLKTALAFGAKDYVAVEPFNTTQLLNSIKGLLATYHDEESWLENPDVMKSAYGDRQDPDKHNVHVSKSDTLSFLEKMPANIKNVVFLISGQDRHILRNESYAKKAEQELLRISSDDTIVVNYASDFFHYYDKEHPEKTVARFSGLIESDVLVYQPLKK